MNEGSQFGISSKDTEAAMRDFRQRIYEYLERGLEPVVSGVEDILEVEDVMDKFLGSLEVVVDRLIVESFANKLKNGLTNLE